MNTQADQEHTALTRDVSEQLLNRVREVAASINRRVQEATNGPPQTTAS